MSPQLPERCYLKDTAFVDNLRGCWSEDASSAGQILQYEGFPDQAPEDMEVEEHHMPQKVHNSSVTREPLQYRITTLHGAEVSRYGALYDL